MNEIKRKLTLDRPVTYQIKVPAYLDESWSEWDSNIEMVTTSADDGTAVTTLTCVLDQAALHGLMRRLYSLGLPLMSVIWVEENQGR
jgi:hypothetical protein